jgi:hypothetical protein
LAETLVTEHATERRKRRHWDRNVTSGKGEYAKVKPYEAAYKEALKQLGPEGLKLVKVEFGYKAESADVQQEEMGVVYQFVFKAEQERKGESLPPRMVEIPAIETIEW